MCEAVENKVRVIEYEATVYYKSTGSSSKKKYPFTQAQADEVGAILEKNGIDFEAGKKLCEKWSRNGNKGDIIYSYNLPLDAYIDNQKKLEKMA